MSARTPVLALALLAPLLAPAAHAEPPAGKQRGSITGRVTVEHGGKTLSDRSGVVVSVEGVAHDRPAPMRASIRQHKRAFEPALLVVTVDSIVDFPNDDKIFHNVFSLSRAARFDLGLYKSGTSKSVTVRRPGVVDVHCNIHPEMVAKIRVVDTSFFAMTDADGTFRIDNVPPGTYTLVAWRARGGEQRVPVTVTAGSASQVEVAVEDTARPTRHLRKDGTPYGRYR